MPGVCKNVGMTMTCNRCHKQDVANSKKDK